MDIHPATIRTERLILRPWRDDDVELFAKLNADPHVREFFPSTMSQEESDREARLIMKFMQERGWCFWAVEVPGVAKFIGMIGLDTVDFPVHFAPAVEIGWRLAFDHWGHGYATEGARASLQYGFQTLELKEIVAYTALANQRSQRVMEHIGMHHSPADDFDFPNVSVDCKVRQQVLYRIKRDEWEQSPAPAQPWYKDGLRFKCTGCGKCCTGNPGYVWVTIDEMASMAQLLGISINDFKKKYIRQRDNRYALVEMKLRNYDCVFLKDRQCLVYQARPKQCRTFPWWKENLHSEASWEIAARSCEGINPQAPLVPWSEIEKALKENELTSS